MSDSFAKLEGQAMTDLIRFIKLLVESAHLQSGVITTTAQVVFSRMREIPVFLFGLHAGITRKLFFVEYPLSEFVALHS